MKEKAKDNNSEYQEQTEECFRVGERNSIRGGKKSKRKEQEKERKKAFITSKLWQPKQASNWLLDIGTHQ